MSRWMETNGKFSYRARSTELDDAALKAIFQDLLDGRSNKYIRKRHGIKSFVLRDLITKFKTWMKEDTCQLEKTST